MNARALSAYGALGLPLAMAMLPVYIISPKFYGDTLGVDITILGVMLFLARLIDTVQDPYIGRLVDYLQSVRHGWTWLILISTIFLAVGFVMLFSPAVQGQSGLLIWLVGCLIVVYTAHSMINVCYLAWGARLTDDVTGRDCLARGVWLGWCCVGFGGASRLGREHGACQRLPGVCMELCGGFGAGRAHDPAIFAQAQGRAA
jgi:Na+/melibiose symporter-like transporter